MAAIKTEKSVGVNMHDLDRETLRKLPCRVKRMKNLEEPVILD